eukprot:366269-Chlamydomonas_euryale.AAC.2
MELQVGRDHPCAPSRTKAICPHIWLKFALTCTLQAPAVKLYRPPVPRLPHHPAPAPRKPTGFTCAVRAVSVEIHRGLALDVADRVVPQLGVHVCAQVGVVEVDAAVNDAHSWPRAAGAGVQVPRLRRLDRLHCGADGRPTRVVGHTVAVPLLVVLHLEACAAARDADATRSTGGRDHSKRCKLFFGRYTCRP